MLFIEKKNESGFTYDVEDIFGTINIESEDKLTPELLDDMVVLLLRQNSNAGEIKGEVKTETGIVKYLFKKRPLWDDKEETCENTPTSTPKPESASTRTRLLRFPILSWCARFAEAFREAWKKGAKSQRESDAGKNY